MIFEGFNSDFVSEPTFSEALNKVIDGCIVT